MSDRGHGLNPAQLDAVAHGEGPLLVLAGAGSGKTRVITRRIVELLGRGVEPYRLLAVTFTNKAAQEMRDRVARALPGDPVIARALWMGTFHSTSARLLRRYADRVGLSPDFVIFDDNDQRTLMARLLKELGIADRFATPRAMLSAIDQAKNRGQGPEDFQGEDYFSDLVARVYPAYQERLERANGVDFGDLLLKALRLCRDPEAGPQLGARFDHVLVDEFQDTNRVQYELVRHLAGRTGNLCVVGDDDQSIYGWRGADVRNILDFDRDFPGTRVVKLERNYRSTQVILDAANGVIARNQARLGKRLYTEQLGGEPILYVTAEDDRREAELVARVIRRLSDDEGRAPEDFAVFYRTHAQSRVLEEALRLGDLPYTVVGGTRFYDRAEVKDVLAYLRLVANPADEVSLERVINRPTRGIGGTTYERVVARARAGDQSVWEALGEASTDPALLGPGPRRKVAAFVALIEELRSLEGRVGALAEAVLDRSGYLERLAAENTAEAEERRGNVLELVRSIHDYEVEVETREGSPPGLAGFLEAVSLVSPADDRTRGVSLMTVHAAKGLEFPVVFVTGLEEGVFPSLRRGEDAAAIEEERRLAYVSLTRARERLFLTNALERRLYGQAPRPFEESRFVSDIPQGCIARPVPAPRARPGWGAGTSRGPGSTGQAGWGGGASGWGRASTPVRRTEVREGGISVEYEPDGSGAGEAEVSFRLGQRVRHSKFGEGEVRGFTGAGPELKLTVYFPQVGAKTIVARFVEAV